MPKLVKRNAILWPFEFYGVLFEEAARGMAHGTCPWCDGEKKFAVSLERGADGRDPGLWHCVKCQQGSEKGGGNLLTFLRMLWAKSDELTNGNADPFARERNLLYPETLTHWGICQSVIDGSWLVPGYNRDGKLCQLYKRIFTGSRWELRPTPSLGHAVHGIPLFKRDCRTVYLHESWGNALAFWEVARAAKTGEDGNLAVTGSEENSILADASVLAVANCGAVGKSLEPYLPLLAGKHVVLCFDNDHPKENGGKTTPGGAFLASQRAAKMLDSLKPACEVSWVAWGPDGWSSDLEHGYDVRDLLDSPTVEKRIADLKILLNLVCPVPQEWMPSRAAFSTSQPPRYSAADKLLRPMACDSWDVLVNEWKKAMRWRDDLEDVLASIMAVCLSTEQAGDCQLFLQLIGDASSAKTTFLKAALVSEKCKELNSFTGFFSGYKDRDDGKDYSLLARINKKTLISTEGDVITSLPQYPQIMSQMRQIFDGSSTSTYKNLDDDRRYDCLRTPWIMAGTPAMLDHDQSRLGDRFMRIWMTRPDIDEQRAISTKVGYLSRRAVRQQGNSTVESHMTEDKVRAYRMTGGYVDWLRNKGTELIAAIPEDNDESVIAYCEQLAEFVADLRARPHKDHEHEGEPTKEQPHRLTDQFCRMSACLHVATKQQEDELGTFRILRRMAHDMTKGWPYQMCRILAEAEGRSATAHYVASKLTHTEEWAYRRLRFLRTIGVVDWFTPKSRGEGDSQRTKWELSERMLELWYKVVGGI